MLQVKILKPDEIDLETSINAFLSTMDPEAVKDIKVDNTGAMVIYEVKEAWCNALCCDCQHWDDGGNVESVSGLCQECGIRKRFNCKACKHFKDVRG